MMGKSYLRRSLARTIGLKMKCIDPQIAGMLEVRNSLRQDRAADMNDNWVAEGRT